MVGVPPSSKTAAQPSGGLKSKGETPTGCFGTTSMGKSGRRAHQQVDRCCNCTQHSTSLTLGPSRRACECQNSWRQCMYCVCWRHCKNRGAFLLRTPGEGLYRHFRTGTQTPPANPSHFWAPQAAHRTKGGSAERGEGGGGNTLRTRRGEAGRTG